MQVNLVVPLYMRYVNLCSRKYTTMAAQPKHVDYGNTESEFQFRFDTSKMKAGDHLKAHFTGDEFIDHVGITSADLFNPTGATITTNAVSSQFGISAFHGKDGGVTGPTGDWIRTGNRVPIRGDKIDSEHQHVTMPGGQHTSALMLRPTADQFKTRERANNRKGIPMWAGMDPSNVTAGTFKSTLNDKVKYIIPQKDVTGKPNAMYAYMHKNRAKKDFMNGEYHTSKAKMTNLNGVTAYTVENEDHFHAMKNVLGDLLETHSPYKNGLGVSVTKLDNIKDDKPLVVSVKFARKPLNMKDGFQGIESENAVTETHMKFLVNGKTGTDTEAVTSSGAIVSAPGHEETLQKMTPAQLESVTTSFEPVE